MLVLTRTVDEDILIGDDITIRVVKIGPHSVKIGITAPAHVNIARRELLDSGAQADKAVEDLGSAVLSKKESHD
jgi:carbon storage regulator